MKFVAEYIWLDGNGGLRSKSRTVEIKVIPSGDTTGDQHIIFGDITVSANTTTVIDLAMVIPANASVAAKCSAATSVNIHVSGVEVS